MLTFCSEYRQHGLALLWGLRGLLSKSRLRNAQAIILGSKTAFVNYIHINVQSPFRVFLNYLFNIVQHQWFSSVNYSPHKRAWASSSQNLLPCRLMNFPPLAQRNRVRRGVTDHLAKNRTAHSRSNAFTPALHVHEYKTALWLQRGKERDRRSPVVALLWILRYIQKEQSVLGANCPIKCEVA